MKTLLFLPVGFYLGEWLLFLMVGSMPVQARFTLAGEFRPRTEYRHGYKTLVAAPPACVFFTNRRIDLVMAYLFATDIVLKEGYPQMFAVSATEAIKRGSQTNLQQGGWLMISLTPTLLKSTHQ